MSFRAVSWLVIRKDDKYAFVTILEDGTACVSHLRFDTKEQTEYWGNWTYPKQVNYMV
jgi:hypothetical protein